MLTEAEVQRSFRRMFDGKEVTVDMFTKGEELIDELRPESPLRHRLLTELDEIRQLCTAGQ